MKKTLKILCVFLVLLVLMGALSGCGETRNIKKHFNEVVKEIKSILYDPDSLQVLSAEGCYSSNDENIIYRIEYRAKNMLGSYVGSKTSYYYYKFSDGSVFTFTDSEYVDIGKTSFGITKSNFDLQSKGEKFDVKYFYTKVK